MKINAKTIAQLPTSPDQHKADVIYFDDDMPGFGIRFRRSGDRIRKSWVVQYRHAGATRRMLLGSDVLGAEQARAAAKKLLAKVALGEDPQGDKAERRHRDTHTLLALVTDYVAWKEGTAVRPATMTEARRYLLDARYFGALHGMPLDRIARRDVAAQILRIAKGHGAVTSSRARTCLSSAFTWAMQQGLCEHNAVVGTLAPQGAKPRERVLDDGELAAVWREAGDDDFGRIVRLLILTGQRRTEVGGMTWAEVDRDRGTWTIPAGRTKNGRTHTLPLSALAMNVIASARERVGRDHLFGSYGPSGFSSWAWSKRYLDERLGDRVKAWTLHDLRRSCATRMCDLGVAPHVVEQILNHQSGHRAGIVGVYNRSSYEREVRAALALWADHIRSITEGGGRKIVPMPVQAS